MDNEKAIQEIRELISESKTTAALDATRALLERTNNEHALVQLDMVESEWHDIRAKSISGLLKSEDEIYFQNLTKAKLLELVLNVGGDKDLARQLREPAVPYPPTPVAATGTFGESLKNGIKNTCGVTLVLAGFGSTMGDNKPNYIVAAIFIFCGLVAFVPTLQYAEKYIGQKIPSWVKYGILIAGLAVSAILAPPQSPPEKVIRDK